MRYPQGCNALTGFRPVQRTPTSLEGNQPGEYPVFNVSTFPGLEKCLECQFGPSRRISPEPVPTITVNLTVNLTVIVGTGSGDILREGPNWHSRHFGTTGLRPVVSVRSSEGLNGLLQAPALPISRKLWILDSYNGL